MYRHFPVRVHLAKQSNVKLVKWKPRKTAVDIDVSKFFGEKKETLRTVKLRRPSDLKPRVYSAEEDKELDIYVDMNTTVNSLDQSYVDKFANGLTQ